MAEPLPPYGLQYPDETDDRSLFPALLQQNLIALSSMVVGQFDTQASAQAALGTSSQAPVFYTTQNPTTLWCLDASGANQVWTLGGGYTSGSFVLTDDQSNTVSLGTSQRYLNYRVEGAHCYGWGEWVVGSSVGWPAAGAYFRFPLPFAVQTRVSLTQMSVGTCMVTVAGKHYAGVVEVGTGSSSAILYISDLSRSPNTTLLPVSPVTGSGTTTGFVWSSGDVVRYSFDYERQV